MRGAATNLGGGIGCILLHLIIDTLPICSLGGGIGCILLHLIFDTLPICSLGGGIGAFYCTLF